MRARLARPRRRRWLSAAAASSLSSAIQVPANIPRLLFGGCNCRRPRACLYTCLHGTGLPDGANGTAAHRTAPVLAARGASAAVTPSQPAISSLPPPQLKIITRRGQPRSGAPASTTYAQRPRPPRRWLRSWQRHRRLVPTSPSCLSTVRLWGGSGGWGRPQCGAGAPPYLPDTPVLP